jgi:hypothetical protein
MLTLKQMLIKFLRKNSEINGKTYSLKANWELKMECWNHGITETESITEKLKEIKTDGEI